MTAVSSSLVKLCFLYVSLTSAIAMDDDKNTFALHQTIRNGDTLISANNRFQLGFFNLSSARESNRVFWYLGIWYVGIKPLTVVWIANRSKPLRGNRVELHLNPVGNLLLRDDEGNSVFIARLNNPTVFRPSLLLLDSGNLVVKDGNNGTEGYVWQSFDYPSDTLLPGMKLGWDLKSKANRVLRSWRSSDDPVYGDYVFSIKSAVLPQLLLENNDVLQSRWGPWNGERFSGSNIRDNPVFRPVYHFSSDEVYFMFEMLDSSILLRLVVTSVGSVQFLKWNSTTGSWVQMVALTKDMCDRYGSCGPYATCHADDQGCRCLNGFLVSSPHDWRRFDFSNGCRRKSPLNCSQADGFVKYRGLKLPSNFTVLRGLSIEMCGDYCLKECSCMAYTSIKIYGHHRDCVVWLDALVDIRASTHDGDELYIRMARVELDKISHTKKKKKKKINVVMISSLVIAAILGAAFWCAAAQFRSLSNNTNIQEETQNRESSPAEDDDQYVQLFDMSTISAATSAFSFKNKIGQGGFGPVYKGELENGQQVAVKRLSESSNQGLEEFKNEMNLIAQLQHRNLVKLLGCCIHGRERMLVYEYMPNKSLDQFIFEAARKRLLSWGKRFSILKGVAKGLDYLHFGSRLRVVHRDLKASNVLLDDQMNPKISDFGLARKCENDKQETTRRVIGTHGYMSPEYVMDGHYSTISDVFSFGVVALEVISGQRNWGFHHPDHEFNLLGHAWKLWKEGRGLKLLDPALEKSKMASEVHRCIHVGLLCVQHSTEERPTMSQVVSMLENENVGLAEPQEPGFCFFTPRSAATGSALGWIHDISVNGLTVTELTGRP